MRSSLFLMGFEIPSKEPDWRNVSKKLVKVGKPCVSELSALMDCMKRSASTAEADSGCSRERTALQACAQKSSAASAKTTRNNMYNNLNRLVKSWKRFGY